MYRSEQDRKYRKMDARAHAARYAGQRSKLSVAWSELSFKEYNRRYGQDKCHCSRCIDGKSHKHYRSELMDPFEGQTMQELFNYVRHNEEFQDEFAEDIERDMYNECMHAMYPDQYDMDGVYMFPEGYVFNAETAKLRQEQYAVDYADRMVDWFEDVYDYDDFDPYPQNEDDMQDSRLAGY